MRPRRSRFLKLQQLLKGKFLLALLVIAAMGGAVYGLFFTPFLATRAVEVTTAYKDINVENLRKAIHDLVVGKNLLLVSKQEVARTVYDTFPDVSSLGCGRKFFSLTFECEAIGYELVAIIKHETERYYINELGVVISYDNRKLGLPYFDLLPNPVFAEIEPRSSQPDAQEATEGNNEATVGQ